jgi:hypothetical protein
VAICNYVNKLGLAEVGAKLYAVLEHKSPVFISKNVLVAVLCSWTVDSGQLLAFALCNVNTAIAPKYINRAIPSSVS